MGKAKQRHCYNALLVMRKGLVVLILISVCFVLECCSSKPRSESTASHMEFGDVRVTPISGLGQEGRFRVILVPKPGGPKAAMVGLLINARQDGAGACYVFRSLTGNESLLVADSGQGSTLMGKSESVGNLQCELLRDGTSSRYDESQAIADFHVRFRSEFRGQKHLYAILQDEQGCGADFKTVGEWSVE
jgi:hypothetical protein